MKMSLGKRRLVSGVLVALTATALLACNRGGKEEQQGDPLGYYSAAEYSRFQGAIVEEYTPDATTAAIQNAVRNGHPIAIRLLMDKLFTDHGNLYYGLRNFQSFNSRAAADKVWAALNQVSASIRYEGSDIGRLKNRFERTLADLRRLRYTHDVTRQDSFSIAARLEENRGNAYSSTLLFDMFLRIHLGANYPADRMVIVFTDGDMRIAELRDGNLLDFPANAGLAQPYAMIDRNLPMRVVRTDDFLFAEAMKMQIQEPVRLIDGATEKFTTRYGYAPAMAGQCVSVQTLRHSIFAWGAGATACVQQRPHRPHMPIGPQGPQGPLDPRFLQPPPPQHSGAPAVDPRLVPQFEPHRMPVDPRSGRTEPRAFQPDPRIGGLPGGQPPRFSQRGRPAPEREIDSREPVPSGSLHVPGVAAPQDQPDEQP